MKALVIGYGKSGKSAAAFLKKRGYEVIAVDRKEQGVLPDSADLPLDGISLAILSPGIPQSHPLVQKVLKANIELIGEMELGFRFLKNRCFGITGSNGKTTAVLLAAHLLNEAGKKARALGNVGEPLTSYDPDPDEILILELSSFQLESLESRRLDAAFVLNITPNHLDRYGEMEPYVKAKARIQNCLKEGGELFVSTQVLKDFGSYFPGAKNFEVDYTESESRIEICQGGAPNLRKAQPTPKQPNLNKLGDAGELKFGGCPTMAEPILESRAVYTEIFMASRHSVQTALLICQRCGVTDLRGLETFKRPAHRIEWVAEIGEVSYYNDSKASNIHAVLHAVEQFAGPLVLIVGGLHKGSSYKPWIEPLKGKVRKVIAYGQAAPLMELELASSLPFQKVEKFADAVKLAKIEAKQKDTVLLSPGCSSYDQFESFEKRGEEFKRLVRES
jgi:UDP-N-acetylmuramoylalanine--D-glutamate ligase